MPIDWRRWFGRQRDSKSRASPGAAGPQAFRPPWPADEETRANLAIFHLRENLLRFISDERGVHSETLMVMLGAFAGHAAALAAHQARQAGSTRSLMSAETADGAVYYFGDALNVYLVQEDPAVPSLWGLIAAAALSAGVPAAELPQPDEMFAHVTSTIGSPAFGQLRIGEDHRPRWPPRETLDAFWPLARPLLLYTIPDSNQQPLSVAYWPTVIGIVAQHYIGMTKEVLDPRLSLRLVMESAIFMSKVDPKTVPQEAPVAAGPAAAG